MKYDLNWLLELIETEQTPKFLFFWGHQPAKNGEITSSCFSQWWEQEFVVENIIYKTAEHYMMAQKALLFDDKAAYKKVLAAKTAAEAKKIGREVENFDEIVWNEKRFDIVKNGNFHKFNQHEKLEYFLLQTENKVLVEASPVDKIWGIGLVTKDEKATQPTEWKGLNLLGFVLMEVRELLKR